MFRDDKKLPPCHRQVNSSKTHRIMNIVGLKLNSHQWTNITLGAAR